MKKILFVLLLGIFATTDSYSQTFIEHDNFSGKVKLVTTVKYTDTYNDSVPKKKIDSTITAYSSKGLPVTDSTFDFDFQTGAFQELFVNQCDDNGHVIKRFLYDDKNNLKEIVTYTYNGNGKLKKAKAVYSDGSLDYKTDYSYDNNENLIVEFDHFTDQSQNDKMVYSYDNNGRRIEADQLVGQGVMQEKITYTYNAAGQKIKEDSYGVTSIFNFEIIYKYNSNGWKAEEDNYKPAGKLLSRSTSSYQIDSNGNWTKKLEADQSQPATVSNITYRQIKRYIIYYL